MFSRSALGGEEIEWDVVGYWIEVGEVCGGKQERNVYLGAEVSARRIPA